MEIKQNSSNINTTNIDPLCVMQSYVEICNSWLSHPEELNSDVMEFMQLATKINLNIFNKFVNENYSTDNNIIPYANDEQLKDELWEKNPVSNLMKDYYLLVNHWLINKINASKDLDEITKKRASFWTQQILNSMCPANFFFLNPRAIQHFIETKGESLIQGFKLLLEDLSQQDISMVDQSKFKVGKNIAATPGKVIFQNEYFELIQYSPVTDKVHNIPILIVPPWINKFYVLDLNEKKSLIKYLLKNKFTVFLISWKNPPASMRNATFTDYLMEGILKAVNVTKEICNVEQVHTIGYCVGGTALGTLLAWLNSNQKEVKQNPIAHFTLFCSLFTFEQPGDIDIFIDEKIVDMLENMMAQQGYLDGKQMGTTFRLLRSNSLIWNYFTNSYLLGKKPMPFDVLFWNTDNTRLPEKMHSFYLRKFYLENSLAKKNQLEIKGQKLDLSKINQPVYAVGTEQDHITPWEETFKSILLTGGEKRYALSTSGHIVGILNPPVKPAKRQYWVNTVNTNASAESWLKKQTMHDGSWWEDWVAWLDDKCGKLVSPPSMGNAEYKIIYDAPGKYVLEK